MAAMAYYRRIPGNNFAPNESEHSASSPPLASDHGRTELKVSIDILQQRLKSLNEGMLKTGSVSPETAILIKFLETTLRLCQNTYKKVQESHRRIVSFTVTDTLPQIHDALQAVSKFMPVDMPKKLEQSKKR